MGYITRRGSGTEAAQAAGREFAAYLNATPHEAQNWRPLENTDNLPDGDYVDLRDRFGEVSQEMEKSYRLGFNDEFVPIGKI